MGEIFVISNTCTTAKVSPLDKCLKDIKLLKMYKLRFVLLDVNVSPRICVEGLYRTSFTQQNLPSTRYAIVSYGYLPTCKCLYFTPDTKVSSDLSLQSK